MKDTSLKTVVIVNEAYPTLMAELTNMPVRLRAERLRALATLGLMVESGNLTRPISSQVTAPRNIVPNQPAMSRAIPPVSAVQNLEQKSQGKQENAPAADLNSTEEGGQGEIPATKEIPNKPSKRVSKLAKSLGW